MRGNFRCPSRQKFHLQGHLTNVDAARPEAIVPAPWATAVEPLTKTFNAGIPVRILENTSYWMGRDFTQVI
jgi:hypothetical protein